MALTQTEMFDKVNQSKQKSESAQKEENAILGDYERTIGQIAGSRDGITEDEIRRIVRDEISKNSRGSGSKETIWSTTETGTRTIDFNTLNKNISDYDLVIVYYMTVNSSGEITFDTNETAQYITNYTFSSSYAFGYVKMDLENNKITMTLSSNYSGWTSENLTYLTKVIGIKL